MIEYVRSRFVMRGWLDEVLREYCHAEFHLLHEQKRSYHGRIPIMKSNRSKTGDKNYLVSSPFRIQFIPRLIIENNCAILQLLDYEPLSMYSSIHNLHPQFQLLNSNSKRKLYGSKYVSKEIPVGRIRTRELKQQTPKIEMTQCLSAPVNGQPDP